MILNQWNTWVKPCVGKAIGQQRSLFALFLALFISLPTFTFQILPSYAGTKNKKISYKETRERKHGKNKSDLKAQVITSGLVFNLDARNIDNAGTAATNTTTATTWTDLSGSGNNGTLNNFTLPTSTTMSGWDRADTLPNPAPSVLKFDATNDYVRVTTTTLPATGQPLSWGVWVKFNSVSGSQRTIDRFFHFSLVNSNGVVATEVFNGAGSNNYSVLTTTFPLTANTWYRLDSTFDGTTLKCYANGTLIGSTTAASTSNPTQPLQDLTLGGGGNTGSSSRLNGQISNARIYNVALTADQVLQNYLAEVSNFPNIQPSNPVVSSATLNGNSISTTSPFRVTDNQTLVLNFSSMDYYPNNKTTIACSPPAGIFSSSPGFNSTANLTFTPTRDNIGMTYSYTVAAVSDSRIASDSNLAFSVIVTCGSDNGCQSGQVCRQGTCCLACPYNPNICDDGGISAADQTPILNLDTTNIDNAGTAASSSTTTTTWTDLSGNRNNGTLNNFTLPTAGSASGWDGANVTANPSVLKFDGVDDYVDVNSAGTILSTANNYTLTAWFNATSLKASGWDQIVDTRASNNNTPIRLGAQNRVLKCVTEVPNTSSSVTLATNPTGQWVFAACTYNAFTMALTGYYNGTTKGSTTVSGSTNSSLLSVGRDPTFAGELLTGSVANVRIYSSTLSYYQIYQNYLAESSRFGVTVTTPPTFTCNASLVSAPPPFTPASTPVQTPVPQLSPSPTPQVSPSPAPRPTATPSPVQNITNSGSSTSSQGTTIPQPSVNSIPPPNFIPFDLSQPNGLAKPPQTPQLAPQPAVTSKPSKPKSIDFSKPELYEVETDFAKPYIDLSKDGKQEN